MGVCHENSQWLLGGAKYAAYNIGALPALLFATRYIESRREAFFSGALAGVIGIFPGLMIYTAMLSQYPDIISEAVPINFVLTQLGSSFFQLIFQIILLGTFIETGIGLIHGYNERIAGVYHERGSRMPRAMRFLIAMIILVMALFIANALGLIRLIAQGYGTLTWGFWLVFVLPVLTIGIWKILRWEKERTEDQMLY